MSKLQKVCRLAGAGGILAALVMLPLLLAGTAANAQTVDAFYVNYFANAQGTAKDDDIVRLIDTQVRTSDETGTDSYPYPMCAMVYVFDEFQEMQECCGCPLSAGARLDLSVDGLTYLPFSDYLNNGLPPGATNLPSLLFRGTIKIVATNSTTATINSNATINGPCAGSSAVVCDPTLGNPHFGFYTPQPYIRAWETHFLTGGSNGYVTETRFERTDEPSTDLTYLGAQCSSNRDRTNYSPNSTFPGRGNCAAVCEAGGINPYPAGLYGFTQSYILENENGQPQPLCYTGQ